MNVNRLLGILAILLLTAASALYAQKPVKVKGVQGRWQVSDDITLKQAEERAFMEAKKAALQKAGVMEMCGRYLARSPRKTARSFMKLIRK